MVVGEYVAKDDGLKFRHVPGQSENPTTPELFLENFRKDFIIRILEKPSKNHLVLELIHVDTSFVNALRRILLSEVPTVAVETIYMWQNNSIIHDEVMAHRIGLIPLQVDARLLDPKAPDDDPTDRNTVVFRLKVDCPKDARAAAAEAKSMEDVSMMNEEERSSVVNNPELEEAARSAATASDRPKLKYPKDRPYTKHVYSKDLVWMPQGTQEDLFGDSARPIHDDILIAKLRPGQSIELEAHAQRGIGKDHAKYSPVSTASYRLMPKIELLEPIYDELAEELVYVYEPGVFELVPCDPKIDPPGTRQKAIVCNPYACTMSRNYARNPILNKSIRMSRIADHFIFSIESVGMYTPAVLLSEALKVLQTKCQNLMDMIDEHTMSSQL